MAKTKPKPKPTKTKGGYGCIFAALMCFACKGVEYPTECDQVAHSVVDTALNALGSPNFETKLAGMVPEYGPGTVACAVAYAKAELSKPGAREVLESRLQLENAESYLKKFAKN